MSAYEEPNYTQAPNTFFDEILPQIDNLSELKVTLVVIRQTFGYHKEEDELSISRLVTLTGLSRPSVIEGVKRGLKRGTIGRRVLDPEAKQDRFGYHARVVKNLNHSSDGVVKDLNQKVVKNLNPQKKEKESTTPSEPNGSSGDGKASPPPSQEASPDVERDTFGYFCWLAQSLEVLITPEDRKHMAKHFKDLKRLHTPTRPELHKVVSKMLEARTSGYDMSPQKALDKVRNGNQPRHLRVVSPKPPMEVLN
jgi:hypothetical protein